MSDLAVTVPRQTGPHVRPLVVVLHTAAEATLALQLIRAWAPRMPAGELVGMAVEPHDVPAAIARLQALVHGGAPGPEHTIVVGVCGAARLALQVVLTPDAWTYAGVLACGPMPLPVSPLAQGGAASGAKLRLIWTARDPVQGSIAMGALLRCLQEAGLDAQGAVLGSTDHGPGHGDEGCGQAASLARLSGAYLAELVAGTLRPSRGVAVSASAAGGGATA